MRQLCGFCTCDKLTVSYTHLDVYKRQVDNHAYKETFGCKAKMLKGDEVEAYTNHAIGGVCPFGVPANTRIYLDVSLKRFDFVYPACGTPNSAIRLTIAELETLLPQASWVDVCRVA